MKARYIDKPASEIGVCIDDPYYWESFERGRECEISPYPEELIWIDGPHCGGPWFEVISEARPAEGFKWVACIHVIELDESQLEAAVEAIAKNILWKAEGAA